MTNKKDVAFIVRKGVFHFENYIYENSISENSISENSK